MHHPLTRCHPFYCIHQVAYPGLVLKKKTVDILDTPDTPCDLTIEFAKGEPVKVSNMGDGTVVTDPLELFLYLNKVGGVCGNGEPQRLTLTRTLILALTLILIDKVGGAHGIELIIDNLIDQTKLIQK